MIEGLKRARPQPSRTQLASALEGLPELDFGGYHIRFGKDNRHGSHFVDLGVVTSNGDLRF